MSVFLAAAVQMRSGTSPERNAVDFERLVREAASKGARYVQTPEMTGGLLRDKDARAALFTSLERDVIAKCASRLSAELGIFLHVGSTAILREDGKLANRSLLYGPDGALITTYDKIHMFDVDLPNGEVYRESANYEPGTKAVVAQLPWGKLGFSICYDLRFPYLYRALAKAGATLLAVPAAFTKLTGEAHWVTLLRARAIEAQCFVLAAAQGGLHEHGRETFGHSLVVSPWGEVLAEGGVHPSVIFADVDLSMIEDVRSRVPSLRHDRSFDVVAAETTSAAEVAR